MSEHQKIDLDELISLYLDGELSVRQETELKRLMQHDPSITERLNAMRQQQQLLNALPVETAPASLLDDIRTQMERKLILDSAVGESQSILATGHLIVRRFLTTAAMILVPLGLLGLVVFQIMKPPAGGPTEYAPVRDLTADAGAAGDAAAPVAADPLPFKGTLVLRTENFDAVNKLVKEAIDKQNLLGQAFPDRSANRMRFNITASPKQVAALVDALTPIRPQCSQVALRIQNDDPAGNTIEIPEIRTKQFKMLVYEDNPEMFTRLASRYASANLKVSPVDENSPLSPDGYPEPTIPTLAGNYDTANRTVQLIIKIERDDKSEPQQ